ncbi:hypothetical protein IP88_08315 [alpha proteobacterium AAP81b]|nr:hypothetical protein IP88_08315 [alpha proteobacterium AAP81b]
MRSLLLLGVAALLGGAADPTPVADIVDALKDDSQAAPGERGFDFLKARDAAGKDARAAKSPPPAARTASPHRKARLDMNLEFALDSATLSEAARAEAHNFAVALQSPALARARIVVEGHTDATGSRGYNLALSRRRAEAVVAYLAAEGVARARMQARGFGPDRLRVADRPADPANRRVEVARLS